MTVPPLYNTGDLKQDLLNSILREVIYTHANKHGQYVPDSFYLCILSLFTKHHSLDEIYNGIDPLIPDIINTPLPYNKNAIISWLQQLKPFFRPRIPPPSLRPRDPNNPADRKYFLDPLPQRPRHTTSIQFS